MEGYRYMYNWFTLLYSRNWHSSVKQLYSNKINVKKRLIDQLAEFSGVKDQIWKSNISIEDVRGFWKDLLRSSVIRAVRILTGKKLKRSVSRIKGQPLGTSNTRPGEAEVVARIWRELEVLRAAFYKGCVLREVHLPADYSLQVVCVSYSDMPDSPWHNGL